MELRPKHSGQEAEMKHERDSIKAKIQSMQAIVFIPVIIMIGILLYMMAWQNKQYRQSIRNLTMATEFNFDFKSNIDYKMYRIVIGADTFDTLSPYEELENSRRLFEQLKNSTPQENSKKGLDGIIILIGILEKRIKDIQTSNIIGDYDRNMERLDKDIYVITDLIEETMSDYIYNETKTLESVRQKLDSQTKRVIALCIMVSAYIIVFLMASFSSFGKKITKPIEELCEYTMVLANGSLKVNAPRSNIREIQMLSDRYDHMVVRIGELINHIKEEQELKRKTELKLLQAQINPHFLYNTLNCFLTMNRIGMKKELEDSIIQLTRIFRYTCSDAKLTTVLEEFEFCIQYCNLLKIRYDERLTFISSMEEEAKNISIPRLLIQPLVENALKHGMDGDGISITISISASIKDHTLILEEKNNGIPIHIQEVYSDGKVGIRNVENRIKIFHPHAVFEINLTGNITSMTIKIPLEGETSL